MHSYIPVANKLFLKLTNRLLFLFFNPLYFAGSPPQWEAREIRVTLFITLFLKLNICLYKTSYYSITMLITSFK